MIIGRFRYCVPNFVFVYNCVRYYMNLERPRKNDKIRPNAPHDTLRASEVCLQQAQEHKPSASFFVRFRSLPWSSAPAPAVEPAPRPARFVGAARPDDAETADEAAFGDILNRVCDDGAAGVCKGFAPQRASHPARAEK